MNISLASIGPHTEARRKFIISYIKTNFSIHLTCITWRFKWPATQICPSNRCAHVISRFMILLKLNLNLEMGRPCLSHAYSLFRA